MSNKDEEILSRLSIMCKLLYMQVRPRTEKLIKMKLTKKQMRAYVLCNGKNRMDEIAKKAECSQRLVEGLLPEWEKKGLIVSIGKGPSKRYINIENLEV